MNAPAPALPESAETAPRGFARRALDGVYAASAVLAGIALFGIFFLMMAQMTVRELGTSIPSADDMAGQLCVAVTFLALAQTFRRGELIREFHFGRQDVRTLVYTVVDDLAPGPLDVLADHARSWLDDPFDLEETGR